jgi:hypothetical protein
MKLPKIYVDAHSLTIKVFSRSKAFPKHYRPTLARRLEEGCLELLVQLRSAALSPGSRKQAG